MGKLPWVEQQQLLLSLVQTLNTTLVLSQVLEQVLDAIVNITGAERGFLLLADASPDASRYPAIAGLRLRVAARPRGPRAGRHGLRHLRRVVTPGARDRQGRDHAPADPIPRPLRDSGGDPSRASSACPCARPARRARRGPATPARSASCTWTTRARPSRSAPTRCVRPGARPPRGAGDRERAAVRARAAHDRGAAQDAEAAAAVREARHDRPDGGRHRPRAEHAAHLHPGQPRAARAAGADARPAGDDRRRRPRRRAHPLPGPEAARLQPARARGDGAARRQRRGRAQPRAVPVPDRRPAEAREAARARACRACSASRTSWRWR